MKKIGVGDVRLSAQSVANVMDVLKTERLSYGPYSKKFESEFARLHHRKFAGFVNSGTDALRIGLAAMKELNGWKDGSKVLVPALTFVASLNVILQNNLQPVLVDVDPTYYEMDGVQMLGGHGTNVDVVAVMPVSLFGQPYDSVKMKTQTDAYGFKVIEDSCETMFVGQSRADVTCYSTYACHIISTGVGGLTLTDDPKLASLIRSYANHGRSGVYAGIDDALGQWETMEARFLFERVGFSSRATELEAAIGCGELEDWEGNILTRRRNALLLTHSLSDLPLQLPKERVEGHHAYMMYPVVCDDGVERDALIQHLEGRGIETRMMLPLTSQPYMKKLFGADVEDRFPVAKRINRQGFYVGCHQHLDEGDMVFIADAFRSFF